MFRGEQKKKPTRCNGWAERREASQMDEYIVEYRGQRYEFPTWTEMKEFIEEHELGTD